VKVLDKLIDIIHTQFIDFDALHTRLKEIVDKENNSNDLRRSNLNIHRKRGAESIELAKILESLA
jgi:hypothetical protein